jgi:PAS domain S-box-containing protein
VLVVAGAGAPVTPPLLPTGSFTVAIACLEPRSASLDLLTSTVCDALIVEGVEDTVSIREVVALRPDVPVLVVDSSGYQTAALIREGAEDVLVRDELTASALVRAVAHAVARHRYHPRDIEPDIEARGPDDEFSAAMESAGEAMVITDDTGRIVSANEAACSLLGYSRSELLQFTIESLTGAENVQRPLQWEELRRYQGARLERTIRRQTGESRRVDLSLRRMTGHRFHVTMHDVTARVEAENARRDSESKFRALAEGSAAAIFISQNSKLLYVNPTLEALLGYRADELLGLDPLELIHPDHRAQLVTRPEDRPRVAGGEDRREVRIRTRNGDERWVDLTTAPIVYLGRAAVVGTAIDITDRKALEQRVMASQRLEAVGRLAGGIAHDFNNLLLVISGQSERLLEGLAGGDPLRGAAAAIQGAAERAATLTHQLLAFGRRQMLIPSPIDLNTVVGDMEALLRHSVGKDVALVTQLAHNLPRTRADRAQIEQVLVNLAVNARDAMPQGGRLTLATDVFVVTDELRHSRPWLTDGQFVRLQVSDTGVGVSPDILPHLFEPFFTTKSGGPGSGLGLATVYGVVKQSGGFIWVDSRQGHGTRVTLLLPAVEAAVTEPMTTRPAPRENAVVLLVEDEEAVRELLISVLERAGFEVHAATTGEQALELERQRRFDVLLTDVVLPTITGPQLAREIRRRSPRTRVLFMSGYVGDSLDAAESGGPRAFIQKPFTARALVERVRELLDQPQFIPDS